MSQCFAEVVAIDAIDPHPNADKLEIATIRGAKVVVGKGAFQVGEAIAYFPPDLLIPELQAEKLGVKKYLKHSVYPGDVMKTQCRVAACRLRGTPSYGFPIPLSEIFGHPDDYPAIGTDISGFVQAVKYEPPVRTSQEHRYKFNADAAPDHPDFHRYTDIENYWRYAKAIPEGMPVVFTEKIHGSNIRFGLIRTGDEFEFMVGSRKVNWKPETASGVIPLWWRMLTEPLMELLTNLCDEKRSVIVFGEIYGPGIQDMDYGAEDVSFRAFDISIDGRYCNYDDFQSICEAHVVETVPMVFTGPFTKAALDEHTYGPTRMASPDVIRSKFKDREGVVIRPISEQFSNIMGGRLILKSVSADYLDRKGAQDNE
jgi:RNA ligase (TIGR02306 family)